MDYYKNGSGNDRAFTEISSLVVVSHPAIFGWVQRLPLHVYTMATSFVSMSASATSESATECTAGTSAASNLLRCPRSPQSSLECGEFSRNYLCIIVLFD